jgi:hypothetical protein
MVEGWEAVDFHQSNCKKPRVRSLDPSHYGQSPKVVITISNYYFLKKATDSRRKFGLDGNGNPNYGRQAVNFFSFKNQQLTRSWPLDWRGYFEQGIKWDAPLGSDFGLWSFEASHYAWPKAPLTIFYWLFSARFFGLLTKFGHSIPRPLDLDGHSMKRPSNSTGSSLTTIEPL